MLASSGCSLPNWSAFAEYNYLWIEDFSGQHFTAAPGLFPPGEILNVKQTAQRCGSASTTNFTGMVRSSRNTERRVPVGAYTRRQASIPFLGQGAWLEFHDPQRSVRIESTSRCLLLWRSVELAGSARARRNPYTGRHLRCRQFDGTAGTSGSSCLPAGRRRCVITEGPNPRCGGANRLAGFHRVICCHSALGGGRRRSRRKAALRGAAPRRVFGVKEVIGNARFCWLFDISNRREYLSKSEGFSAYRLPFRGVCPKTGEAAA